MIRYLARPGYDWQRRRQAPAQPRQYQRTAVTAWERQQPRDTSQWHIPSIQYSQPRQAPAQQQARRVGRHPRIRTRIHMR